MGARCPRWGGDPSVGVRKARGSGAAGRSPGVRPIPEPVLSRRSVEGIGERSRSGRGAEGGGEAVLVRVSGAEVLECSFWGMRWRTWLKKTCYGRLAMGQVAKIARGAHTVGKGRVVSHKRRYSRGGCRNTVIVYRSMPLRGERQ